MSSGSERERPMGIIVQGTRVVGAVHIPKGDDDFIKQFNYCYGPMRMECSRLADESESSEKKKKDERFRMPKWSRQLWDPQPATQP